MIDIPIDLTERQRVIWIQDQIFLTLRDRSPEWSDAQRDRVGDLINALESITFARRQKNGCVVAPTRVRA